MEGSIASLREQGVQALREGQLDAAIDLLSRAASADGEDAEAHAFLGLACSRKGLHAQARQALETAIEREPRNARYRCQLGAALEQAADLSGAVRAYHEALQIDPSHPEARERAAALEARVRFSPAAAAEFVIPPPSAAHADAPWLAGQYAAGAGTVSCPSCRQPTKPGRSCEWCGAPLESAAGSRASSVRTEPPGAAGASLEAGLHPAHRVTNHAERTAPRGRRMADPADRDGTRRLMKFLAIYTVAAVCLIGLLLSHWVAAVVREVTLPRPSPAVQSLLARAWTAEQSGRAGEAEHLFQRALEEARVLGDRPGEAASLSGLGDLMYRHKHPRRAIEYLQPAQALFRQLGDQLSLANTLNNLGLAYSDIRQPRQALESLRQALASSREAGDKHLEAAIIDSFGMVYEAAGQPRRALPYYQQTLTLARQIGDQELETLEPKNIARMQRHLSGQPPAAAGAGVAPVRAAPEPGSQR
jgi:tetratricopeptide (TPR) repeat protein